MDPLYPSMVRSRGVLNFFAPSGFKRKTVWLIKVFGRGGRLPNAPPPYRFHIWLLAANMILQRQQEVAIGRRSLVILGACGNGILSING